VILFNNAGISNTSGEVPASVKVNAAAFIKALGLAKVDVLRLAASSRRRWRSPTLVWFAVGTGPRAERAMTTDARSSGRVPGDICEPG